MGTACASGSRRFGAAPYAIGALRVHAGDHLHPNARGGQKLADAFDLGKLTGKET